MKCFNFFRSAATLVTLTSLLGSVAHAAGIAVGSSSLIGTLDYSDTFTVGSVARPDGLYNDNAGGGYSVESVYGNPAATWTPFSNFSFNSPGNTCCGYPGNTGSVGATTGLAQSGGGDFSFTYGLRNNYVVQVDAAIVTSGDRLDISSTSTAGGALLSPNSLNVFFRNTTAAPGLPGLGIHSPSAGETLVQSTGVVSDTNWHNFAVNFDQAGNRLRIYVDQVLLQDLNLLTFAGGAYATYSNAAVGAGAAGAVYWFDNFQVGAVVPEPSSAILAIFGFVALFAARRRAR